MEIKKSTQTKTYVETTYTYIAEDGRKFYCEDECRRYEASLEFEKLNIEMCKDAFNLPNIGNKELSFDIYDYSWYRPKSAEEVDVLNRKYGVRILDSDIGKWICIGADVDQGMGITDSYYTTLSDGIDYAKQLLDKLGYELTIKEKEEN